MLANQNKPDILLITRNLPPLVGGMERLMQQLVLGMADYSRLTVIGPKGSTSHLPKNVRVYEVSAKLGSFLLVSTWRAILNCRATKFDLVIGGSGLIAPTLRVLSLLFGTKTLIYLHGLDVVVDNFFYQKIFTPQLKKLDHVIANSHNTQRVSILKGVARSQISIIHPGTSLPNTPNSEALDKFRAQYGVPNGKVMVFVGRMTRRKGLSHFIKYSLPLILENEPQACLLIVGENPNDSLNKLGEESEVVSLISSLEDRSRVIFLGRLEDVELTQCYACSDVHIFPLIEVPGDVEGFGMVAIEAAALGTPTVAFSQGGVSDAVSEKNGHLILPGQYEAFTKAVLETLHQGKPSRESCRDHAENFSWEVFNKNIRAVTSRLIRH